MSILQDSPLATRDAPAPPVGKFRQAWDIFCAILLLRCPRCRKGKMFRGLFAMNDPCPVCGLIFQREEGYFLGAMYVSYVLGCALITLFYLFVIIFLPDWNNLALAAAVLIPYAVLTPLVFRYARAIWIHFDRAADPESMNAGAYEKARMRQLAEKAAAEGRLPPSA